MRFCELRQKEVVNIRDCQRLGFIADIEFNPHTGEICQIIIPVQGKLCTLFAKEKEYVIGYKCIEQIGSDIILVDVNMKEIIEKPKD